MEPKLIYKDRHLLIIDKPAGVPSTLVKDGIEETVQSWVIDNFPKQDKLPDAGLVNRLDNNTSGLVVVARKDDSFNKLKEIWNKREVIKTYLALVLEQIPIEGKIETLIAHHPSKKKKMMVVNTPEESKKLKARNAITEFKLKESFFDYSLVEIRIITGLRHQIRCHLASIGHPIAGDKLYQKPKHASRDWLNLKRHFLHAVKISFPHPSNGKEVTFESPLPKDLKTALKNLEV